MTSKLFILILAIFTFGAACQKAAPNSSVTNNNGVPSDTATFPTGIYYRQINLNDPSAVLSSVEGSLTRTITMSPVDFDIQSNQAVYVNNDTLHIISPDGSQRTVKAQGIYQMARPTLSPDGKYVAVQATNAIVPGKPINPEELLIFVVNMEDGSTRLISSSRWGPAESPSWFNQSNKIAYSTFSAKDGVDMHIYDLDQNKEVLVIQDAAWHGLAVSKDDTKIFVPNTMRLYSTTDGQVLDNLKLEATAGIVEAKLSLAEKIGDSHSPFLDGDWSPDGTQLVFDAAVVEHSQIHIYIFTMNIDGSNVKVVQPEIEVNPYFSNNLNFSQVNPVWL